MIALDPLGDRALLARFATEEEAGRWARAVRAQGWPGVVDVVLAYQTAAVFADPDRIDLDWLEPRLRGLELAEVGRDEGRLVRLPVLYDGIDLVEVSQRCRLSVPAIIAAHSAPTYRVFAIGFLPGYPYAGYLPEVLSGLPRRTSPREIVPAGSVAIAGRQTGVYPEDSPGGWHLLGRTPLRIVDLDVGHFPIRAGDSIRFEPIAIEEYQARYQERL
jgi:KipI family sensor histidine kinase inhibitor